LSCKLQTMEYGERQKTKRESRYYVKCESYLLSLYTPIFNSFVSLYVLNSARPSSRLSRI